jgi:hypothetical protein
MDLGILRNVADGIAVIVWLWLCDGVPHCRLAAQGVRVFELKFSNYFNHHNTSPIVTMSTLNNNLAFTQYVLEKMEATLSIGLLEKEATFAVAERMVAFLVCCFTFLFFFVADLLVLVFF